MRDEKSFVVYHLPHLTLGIQLMQQITRFTKMFGSYERISAWPVSGKPSVDQRSVSCCQMASNLRITARRSVKLADQ
ncbi:hypothetical protein LSH36_413g02034 [Paralvinella palmiformis]|uniref:Uncharacterized protein n=1 Tax=Paralvinella palmiformis TaxID=53620 RepID=A0AAD9JBT4_9ANNE|nr:hypothetical protein LSH36_413g02034 [Paralvinella palmiformis]